MLYNMRRYADTTMEKEYYASCAVLIPAYKPVYEQMVPFVGELLSSYKTVIAVDDGGGDTFAPVFEACRALGCTVLTHEVNRGKGAALRTGFSYIEQSCPDVTGVVTADCDGQHAVHDIIRVTKALKEYPEAMIIGGRRFDGDVPFRSKFGNGFTRLIYRIATGNNIYDTQTGLRGFQRSLLPDLVALKGDRYEYEMNMLLKLREWGVKPHEIEIRTIYLNDNKGSHFNTVKDSLRIGARVLLFAMGSIASTIIDWALFLLFSRWLDYWWAFGAARVISATCNYLINRKVVFGGKNYKHGTVIKYFSLATVVMFLGMCVMKLFENLSYYWLIKLVYDALMYVVNYFIQRDFVFKINKRRNGNSDK